MESLSMEKNSSFLGLFLSYEENEEFEYAP
jgi:hypothetical protein